MAKAANFKRIKYFNRGAPAPLILASQSTARLRLLKRLGLAFKTMPADIDEASVQKRIPQAKKLVLELAKQKARVIAKLKPHHVIIGADQVLSCAGKIFGKPLTEKKAIRQLETFSGQRISLFNGVCVIDENGNEISWVHQTKMKLRKLSSSEIQDYVRFDQPLECAGSFKFESLGVSLFESVQTDDPTAIEGLPLLSLYQVLRSLGYTQMVK